MRPVSEAQLEQRLEESEIPLSSTFYHPLSTDPAARTLSTAALRGLQIRLIVMGQISKVTIDGELIKWICSLPSTV